MSPPRSVRQAEAGLLLLVLLWGLNFSVIKIGLAVIPPFGFNALRFPLAALLLGGVLLAGGRLTLPDREDVLRLVVIGVVGNVAYQLLFITGMSLTRAGNASVLLTASPVFTALLSGALGHERLRREAWLGIAAATAGIVLVVGSGPAGFGFGTATFRGDLLIVLAAAVWSIYTVSARTPIRKYGTVRVTAWTLWVGTILLVIIGLPDVAGLDAPISATVWAAVIYAGFLGLGLSYLLWYRGVKVLGNTRTSTFGNLVPVVAIFLAWPMVGEVPSPWQLVGAVIILAGIHLVRRGTETL